MQDRLPNSSKCLAFPSTVRRWPVILAVGILAAVAGATPGQCGSPELFTDKDLSGWRQPTGDWQVAGKVSPSPSDPKQFAIEPGAGVLVNGPAGKTRNLVAESEHGDVEIGRAHV